MGGITLLNIICRLSNSSIGCLHAYILWMVYTKHWCLVPSLELKHEHAHALSFDGQ